MRLSGQAKTEFEKWYLKDVVKDENFDQYVMSEFYRINPCMRFGVYVDWFDSVGVVVPLIKPSLTTFYVENKHNLIHVKNRHEARTKAIELGSEFFNNRKV